MPDMRFAPPNPIRIADRSSGLNSLSVRSYNERLVLSQLLQSEETTRLEIGEKTGLSAQTISVIVRSLEQEGLVSRGEAQKGRVGPPTTPLKLNPEGAYSVGISIGARNSHIVVVDFIGSIQQQYVIAHAENGRLPSHEELAEATLNAMAQLSASRRERITGVGLALPSGLSQRAELDQSKLHRFLEAELALPVFLQNDVTAAAAGESLFGSARQLQDFLFFYMGAHLHSRLVLNHQIYHGNSALSFDVGVAALERSLPDHLRASLWQQGSDWSLPGDLSQRWINSCSAQLLQSIAALQQFIELKTVVLSSFIPHAICATLCKHIETERPEIRAIVGKTSPTPKAIGAASLPFSSRFMVN